jgi:hypothetical protein
VANSAQLLGNRFSFGSVAGTASNDFYVVIARTSGNDWQRQQTEYTYAYEPHHQSKLPDQFLAVATTTLNP